MSLSQKHAGLILVPWFNADEWRYVYQLTYSHIKKNQLEALNLLKIWKMRTPILSTGVEGTLILLDVLIVDNESLPDEQIANLYAVALMRFLNLSAANSERQGSFTKTSAKNELPKWLTNLRHDIAHGHQIPSKYNLKMGLDFGFNWLKEKYWDPQSRIINNYYIGDESKLDDTLMHCLQFYVDVNISLFKMIDLDDEFYENIKNIIHKKYKRKNIHPHLILDIFLQIMTQNFEKEHDIEIVGKYLDVLVSTKALLRDNIDTVSENEDTGKMNEKFLKIWTNLINLLHRYGMLFCLVERLFDVIGSIVHSEQSKKMASLWINAVFLSLEMIREPNVSNDDWVLHLEKNTYVYTEDSLEFQKKVLYFSTDIIAPYISTFLDSLLRYNLSNNGFRSDALNLIKVNSAIDNIHEAENRVYSVDDLKVKAMEIEDVEFPESNRGATTESCNKYAEKNIVAGSRWTRIQDAAAFKNCPLGVLPHQINSRHPFLIFA